MKKIVVDFLTRGFPANENFLNFLNEELHNNLLLLCQSLYPDSVNKAYVLYGMQESIGTNITSISQGVIFYNNEIFLVPPYSYGTGEQRGGHGLIINTLETDDKFGDGLMHVAYRERSLAWSPSVSGALLYDNLVRREYVKQEISFNSGFTKYEGKVISNGATETLLVNAKLNNPTGSNYPAAEFGTNISKQGFLGTGKVSNASKGGDSIDVFVYQEGSKTRISPYAHTPGAQLFIPSVYAFITYVNGQNNDVMLHINLTIERV